MKDLTSEKQGRSSAIQDKSGKCLTEEKEILSRWTEYCSELYNYESCGDNAVLDCSQPQEEDLQPILHEEVEIAVASLKKGKSARVDNIPAELVQAGGETMIDVLTEICNRIWRTGEWPTPWTQSLIITLPKKGNLQLCQNYRTISLISHSPGRVAQSVGHSTRKSGVLGSIPGLATYFRFSFRFFKKGSCQLLAKVCARSTG